MLSKVSQRHRAVPFGQPLPGRVQGERHVSRFLQALARSSQAWACFGWSWTFWLRSPIEPDEVHTGEPATAVDRLACLDGAVEGRNVLLHQLFLEILCAG